jgi:hypothetical protein
MNLYYYGHLVPEGYRFATFADKPTDFICRHGIVASAQADDHNCTWCTLVKVEIEEESGE